AEIVSVDSMQVYRGMDIGTAKPTPAERRRVVHHLIDVVDPGEDFSVADTQRIGRAAVAAAPGPAIIAGGTGLAMRAIVDPLEFPGSDAGVRAELEQADLAELQDRLVALDPDAADHVDLANPRRVIRALEIHAVGGRTPSERAATPAARAVRTYESLLEFRVVGLDPGAQLESRAVARFDAMLDAGLLEEVERVAPRLGRTAAQAVGYKELMGVVAGERSLPEARTDAITATMAVAANQRTYFRRDPRITWLEWHDDPAVRLERARRELLP
ncbi:MAG: tRNA (adenosine(37)-N6)-dimethylallyltransferase MiaA, partial [Acidimicrobiia bacterium]|nr:tRNA (adenosine(37)-N6)-dimethylallyltransferase MiaA [Acidimicrobiia bacterium]NNL69809.1 tRNA (adenosine(37)-N6)-dimethylallyltransferase MiaA [Acidimicrobiia bacterium]